MATSYPDRTNARGIWTVEDITKNLLTEGTFPDSGHTRGIFGGGYAQPVLIATSEVVTIATTGSATNFGDLNVDRRSLNGTGSFIRAFFSGGKTPTMSNVVDYYTFTSAGTAADFGDLTNARQSLTSSSSPTRGVIFGGTNPSNVDIMEYITMATTGNAIDFGDLTTVANGPAGVSSPTRGIRLGGFPAGTGIDFFEIATTGNAV